MHAPDNGSDWELAIATWALAAGTVGLCVITGFGLRKQGKDMERSVRAAEASAAAAGKSAAAAADAIEAAARQRREELEREVSSAANRLITTATRVSELAKEVPGKAKTVLSLANRRPVAQLAAPYERAMELRQDAANEAMTAGGVLLGMLGQKRSDPELTAGLRDMDRRQIAVELMQEDVKRQLEGLDREIDFLRQQNEARLQNAGGRLPPVFPGS